MSYKESEVEYKQDLDNRFNGNMASMKILLSVPALECFPCHCHQRNRPSLLQIPKIIPISLRRFADLNCIDCV